MSLPATDREFPFGVAGDPGTVLLAGRSGGQAETLGEHELRLGRPPNAIARDELAGSGLTGRGGGGFPFARKLLTAAESTGPKLVVVNASESEPASNKDRTLLELRPHLVIDGAVVAARTVGAGEVVFYGHQGRATRHLQAAIDERRRHSWDDGVNCSVALGPTGYISGESSSVLQQLEGGPARPVRRSTPAAVRGVAGRPTLVSNVETYAHVALLARYGAAWFRSLGSPESPGSTLITLHGSVPQPGLVVEVTHPVAIGEILGALAGRSEPPRAVLLGGYAGAWLPGGVAWSVPVDRHRLAAAGAGRGCGLIGVLSDQACGLVETARLVRYLAGQSAGQCGPCIFGLPELSEHLAAALDGAGGRRTLKRMQELAAAIPGRGACSHPDGVVRLVQSATDVFSADLVMHRRRGRCGRSRCEATSGFPLPAPLRLLPGGGR